MPETAVTLRVAEIAAAHAGVEGPLLPILHAIQEEYGHVPEEAKPVLAAALNISRAEVHGVVSFYHDFRDHPAGRHVVKLCRAESCQSVGADALADYARARLGVDWHGTTPNGGVTLEPVFCLGLCACGPAAMVNGKVVGRVDAARFDELAAECGGMKVYIPADAAAKALGAEAVVKAVLAEAAAKGVDITIVRNGSRGMVWLEPLVEVETPAGRMAFGPMTAADAKGLFDASHPKALGLTDDLPWMKAQTRLTFARCGVIDPLSIEDFKANGGMAGLTRAVAMTGAQIVDEVSKSGLRGRGGAGFPTGIKWKTVHDAPGPQKYIVANADEGDSGTFADRMIMEGDPFTLIEGMAIAGLAVGATKGYIYSRSEYPDANAVLMQAIRNARAAGMIGPSVLGSGRAFELELRVGAGAYVCGEETALLNSLEGKRGTVRAKPPLPALQGFMGRPTVVNNVISLATVPVILDKGAEHYASFGLGRSKGTIPLQIAGNVKHGGLFEIAFGLTLDRIVNEIGGGSASGRPVKAVQVGGPLGAFLPVEQFDTPFGYEEYTGKNALIGHAGLTVFDDSTDMLKMARFAMEFCAIESCGKCTPCRIGAVRGVETLDRIGRGDTAAIPLLEDLCNTMKSGSLCALGGFTPYPVMSALTHFPEDFTAAAKEAAE